MKKVASAVAVIMVVAVCIWALVLGAGWQFGGAPDSGVLAHVPDAVAPSDVLTSGNPFESVPISTGRLPKHVLALSLDSGVPHVTTSTTRDVFVTNIFVNPGDQSRDLEFTCWLVAPSAFVRPQPGASSVLPSGSTVSWGYSAAELAQIQAGNIVEVTRRTGQIPPGVGLPGLQAALYNACNNEQTFLDNMAPAIHLVGMNHDQALNDGGGGWNAAP